MHCMLTPLAAPVQHLQAPAPPLPQAHVLLSDPLCLGPGGASCRGAAPAWDAELPFPKRTLQGRIANQALITFRQEISQLLATYPLGLMRFTNSNWMSPSQIPRTMNL
jgi:hypothetical protein